MSAEPIMPPAAPAASPATTVAPAKAQPSPRAQALKLNQGLRIFFSQMVRVSLRRPAQAAFFARTVVWQAAAEDVHVPPIAIFSITNKCNLSPGVWLLSSPPWGQGLAASCRDVPGPLPN